MKQAVNHLSAKECNQTLRNIDIRVAIDYFGVTELLDTIGVSEIENYLLMRQVDNTYSEFHIQSESLK